MAGWQISRAATEFGYLIDEKSENVMSFDKEEADQFFAECGQCCCICGRLHRVQVHHTVPRD